MGAGGDGGEGEGAQQKTLLRPYFPPPPLPPPPAPIISLVAPSPPLFSLLVFSRNLRISPTKSLSLAGDRKTGPEFLGPFAVHFGLWLP